MGRGLITGGVCWGKRLASGWRGSNKFMWLEREKDEILGAWDVCKVRLSCKWRIHWTLPSITKENRTLFTYVNKRGQNQKSYVIIEIINLTEATRHSLLWLLNGCLGQRDNKGSSHCSTLKATPFTVHTIHTFKKSIVCYLLPLPLGLMQHRFRQSLITLNCL